jgi:hypothetical protein
MKMNTRLIYASILSLGLLTSVASAENSSNAFCGKGSVYDRESLSCLDFGGKAVTDGAAFAAPSAAKVVNKNDVGDFINESTNDRFERTGR